METASIIHPHAGCDNRSPRIGICFNGIYIDVTDIADYLPCGIMTIMVELNFYANKYKETREIARASEAVLNQMKKYLKKS